MSAHDRGQGDVGGDRLVGEAGLCHHFALQVLDGQSAVCQHRPNIGISFEQSQQQVFSTGLRVSPQLSGGNLCKGHGRVKRGAMRELMHCSRGLIAGCRRVEVGEVVLPQAEDRGRHSIPVQDFGGPALIQPESGEQMCRLDARATFSMCERSSPLIDTADCCRRWTILVHESGWRYGS